MNIIGIEYVQHVDSILSISYNRTVQIFSHKYCSKRMHWVQVDILFKYCRL